MATILTRKLKPASYLLPILKITFQTYLRLVRPCNSSRHQVKIVSKLSMKVFFDLSHLIGLYFEVP